ncbi:hypothetical protein NDU88_007995 [Pleurodeles waltl]|uniref:Uncharacterized protein n=1 Tax=Pleurodeles waltl TaxID=8319 RepID=A0AAV7SUE2_PLEWA|nr:hypothetical protein NDU88_007995 [Pleurodeles waltl]
MSVQAAPATNSSHPWHQLHCPIQQSLQPQSNTGARPKTNTAAQSRLLQTSGSRQANATPAQSSLAAVTFSFCLVSRHRAVPDAPGKLRHTSVGHPGRPSNSPTPRSSRPSAAPFLHALPPPAFHQQRALAPAKITRLAGGQAQPLPADSPSQAPQSPGSAPPSPTLTRAPRVERDARAIVRSDRRGPHPPVEADPPADQPAPGTDRRPGALRHRVLRPLGRARCTWLLSAAGPPPPTGEHQQQAPTGGRR